MKWVIFVLAAVLSVSATQAPVGVNPPDPNFTAPSVVEKEIVGAVIDVAPRVQNHHEVTLVQILNFKEDNIKADESPFKPMAVTGVLLCGNQGNLYPLTHSDVSLVYNARSSSTTGCHDLVSIAPWNDGVAKTITPITVRSH